MKQPLVSIITPTRGREAFLPLIYSCVQAQDWNNIEWLVDDDSESSSPFMQNLSDTRVRYHHNATRRSIGAKRNFLVEQATGEYIAHFDDDDYYSPIYITQMISEMRSKNADFIKLTGFFLYSHVYDLLGYWNFKVKLGLHFVWSGNPNPMELLVLTDRNNQQFADMHLGFGFSYAYRRQVWVSAKFPDVDWNEDGRFIEAATKIGLLAYLADKVGLCLHFMHGRNSSSCFPQFLLPPFLVYKLFPGVEPYFRLPAEAYGKV